MNWINFWVVFAVALAVIAVLLYKFWPAISGHKRKSRKAKNLLHDYHKANKKNHSCCD